MSIKALPARAIYGWDSASETWVKILVDSTGKITITSTDLTTVLSEIQHATYGLSALKTLIDALALEATLTAIKGSGWTDENIKEIVDLLENGTYGLAALETLVDTIETTLASPNNFKADVSALALEATLTAIKGSGWSDENIKEIVDLLEHGTYGLSALETLVDEVETYLKHATYGLSALQALLAAIPTTAMRGTDSAALATDLDMKVNHMDFWSQNDDIVSLNTGTDVETLPNVVVAGLPAGVTLVRVVALLKIGTIKSSAATPLDNGINSATMTLEVSANSDHTSGVNCITIPNNSWLVDVSAAEQIGGDVIIGDIDVKTTVTGNATFYFQFDDAIADAATLELREVAVGLRVYFY